MSDGALRGRVTLKAWSTDGKVFIRQYDKDGSEQTVCLTVRDLKRILLSAEEAAK